MLNINIMLKLRDWIDVNKINWMELSRNPNAIELLKENKDKIDWCCLSKNPNANELLKENKKKLIGVIYHKIQMQWNY